jgi:hypothetical protein
MISGGMIDGSQQSGEIDLRSGPEVEDLRYLHRYWDAAIIAKTSNQMGRKESHRCTG